MTSSTWLHLLMLKCPPTHPTSKRVAKVCPTQAGDSGAQKCSLKTRLQAARQVAVLCCIYQRIKGSRNGGSSRQAVPAKKNAGFPPKARLGDLPAQRWVKSPAIRRAAARTAARYSTLYSILIPRRAISSRKESAGMSRSCKTAPRLLTAPVHIICRTMEAGKAVVRIMALMSLLGS